MPDVPGVYRPDCRNRPYEFPCKRCGRMFFTKRCTGTWCSARCRKMASRVKHHARKPDKPTGGATDAA